MIAAAVATIVYAGFAFYMGSRATQTEAASAVQLGRAIWPRTRP